MERVALGRVLLNGGGLLLLSTAFVNWAEIIGLDNGYLAIGGTVAMVIGYGLGRNEL
ncbi:hypothetical protein [Oceanospirillum beijerinckii]|uniref:hypothetical protein n=1 Tax=Oceanospirillum beijerinckii TaxID=64976 RepID=UPI0004037C11|nr:hypothetical protein [Oceanospirillum beijerinckii]